VQAHRYIRDQDVFCCVVQIIDMWHSSVSAAKCIQIGLFESSVNSSADRYVRIRRAAVSEAIFCVSEPVHDVLVGRETIFLWKVKLTKQNNIPNTKTKCLTLWSRSSSK
jgi:hypothetical protein